MTDLKEGQARFDALQRELARQFDEVFPDARKPRVVVVVPSLTLDAGELAKIAGVHHYEERMLCLLMLLRMPGTQVIYLTSQPVHPTVIDYYLHLLPGVPVSHARRRLTMLSCHDASPRPLTEKILERPRLLRRLREAFAGGVNAHMTCFNATALERRLALELGLPLYAPDPALAHLGTKSGSRDVFRKAGIAMPDGFEHLRDEDDIVEALAALKRRHPALRRAVVKLNEGFSGEGNALFTYEGAPETGGGLEAWVRTVLPERLRFEAAGETWPRFRAKFEEMEGIVECFVEGAEKRSPSAQCRVNPRGEAGAISTHDQVLGGPSGQVFQGATFPADAGYRLAIQEAGLKVAKVLQERGVIGRFGIDFISVKEGDTWAHYAIEINLRKGGTTHPFLMLDFLIDGAYDAATGCYRTPAGQARFYYASDNLRSEAYQGWTAEDLIDIAVQHGLHFHGTTLQGVVFHLIGALSEFGKLGVVCVGDSPERAQELYRETVTVLDEEARAEGAASGARRDIKA